MPSRDSLFTDLPQILVQEKVIRPEDLAEIEREANRTKAPLLDVLTHSERFDDKALVHVFSNRFGYTAVNPAVFIPDEALIQMVPRKFAERYLALPLSRYENTLTVAFANPMDLRAIDELLAITGLRIKPVVASVSILKKLIAHYYSGGTAKGGGKQPVGEEIDDLVKMIQEEQHVTADGTAAELSKEAMETPVIKLVNMLLIEGIRRRASDIFIEPWENYVRVRARVDGLLEEIVRPPKALAAAIVSRIKVMSELNIAEHRIPQDGRFKVKLKERQVDMRVSVLPSSFGEKVCLRILDTTAQSHDISKLGFSPEEQRILQDSARKPHGMILVTGPTGSGKTTTLYSVLKYLDSPEVNVTTVEDPVEYQLPGINQVQVRENIGLTFPVALRSILRQDPDIILIGEIRDHETLDIAVKAALTGHLVLSTLHTNDAASSITRMVNMGLEPFLIASTVLMISAQRLVRRLCPKCRYAQEVNTQVARRLGLDPDRKPLFYAGKGCADCRHTGYSGRTVITEILEMRPEIMQLIMRRATAEEIKTRARQLGMSTLRQCAVRKALEGETSVEEIFRVTTADLPLETPRADKQGRRPCRARSARQAGDEPKRGEQAA